MSTKITWLPSTDANIASYTLQTSPDASTWSALASVTHAIPGPNWDAVNGVFFYNDAAGTSTTWYRINAVDTLAQTSAWSAAFQPGPDYVPPWDTVNSIIRQAGIEVGLTEVTDPWNATDENWRQLRQLLTSAGRDLVHQRDWTHLRKEATFTTVAGQSQYALEPDFHNMIDQTWWNRTNRLPVWGPVSAQEWQYLKARIVNVAFNVLMRPMNREIVLWPETNTPGGFTIAYEYKSAYWISTAGTPDTSTADHPSAGTDYVWFDPLLMIRKLKLDFLKAKKFDTTSEQQDYDQTLARVKAQDAPSPILSATGGSDGLRNPLIDQRNIPITGFGQ